jgi:multiple sugar transport system substrate-binding protein
MRTTLAALQARGLEAPLSVPVHRGPNTLIDAASWVWGAGGDFLSADGRKPLFTCPEALAGFAAYFDLHRYVSAAPGGQTADESEGCFLRSQAAVLLSGPWTARNLMLPDVDPVVRTNTAATLVPGVPFVGGSDLIVWKHVPAQRAAAAIELVKYLIGHRAQALFAQQSSILPVRLDALESKIGRAHV